MRGSMRWGGALLKTIMTPQAVLFIGGGGLHITNAALLTSGCLMCVCVCVCVCVRAPTFMCICTGNVFQQLQGFENEDVSLRVWLLC